MSQHVRAQNIKAVSKMHCSPAARLPATPCACNPLPWKTSQRPSIFKHTTPNLLSGVTHCSPAAQLPATPCACNPLPWRTSQHPSIFKHTTPNLLSGVTHCSPAAQLPAMPCACNPLPWRTYSGGRSWQWGGAQPPASSEQCCGPAVAVAPA
jgi:hypothetical protein